MDRSAEALSQIIVFSKYARYREDLGRRETWEEIVGRVEDMHLRRFPDESERIREAFDYVRRKEVLPSARTLQFAGPAMERDHVRGFNCAFLPMDAPEAFSEVMYLLLCGTGVGFSVQRPVVRRLPQLKRLTKQETFVVPDTKEGWADAVGALMTGRLVSGTRVAFDYSLIRPKGAPLVTTGGKAPGPEPLKRVLDAVTAYLDKLRPGYQLKPIDVHWIVCMLCEAVLAGGVRRSATLSLFSHNDDEMIAAKSGSWWKENPHFARANNSVLLPRNRIGKKWFDAMWQRIKGYGSGEPGIIWSNTVTGYGYNPCQPEFATVLTPDGIRRFKDIDVGSKIWSEDGWVTVTAKWSTGVKPVYTYRTERGVFVGTENHRIVENGAKVEAKDAKGLDYLPMPAEFLGGTLYRDAGCFPITAREYLGEHEVYDITVDGEHHTYWTGGVNVSNCAEAMLADFGLCNLTTLNAATVSSQADLNARVAAAAYLGTLQASYTEFGYLRPIWRQTAERDALIGVSMTGIAAGRLDDLDLTEAALVVKQVNLETARRIGVEPAARTTLGKPEGTASTVLKTSSGIHAYHAPFYLRRVRYKRNEPVAEYLSEHLPELVEPDAFDPDQLILTLPQRAPEGAVVQGEEDAITFLERVGRFNREWVVPGHRRGPNYNNMSATISLRSDEWDAVGEWLWRNRDDYQGLSFLPADDHTYVQAPFEACDRETYDRLYALVEQIDLADVREVEDQTALTAEAACAGGACEVKWL